MNVRPQIASVIDAPAPAGESVCADAPDYELIEEFFFAYRAFVVDPDRLLESRAFGRAHHRVLHFVDRRPGLAIADLLEILRITKQSLNRVLRDLLKAGLVEARAGTTDRRQRRLWLTPEGRHLAGELAAVQSERFALALATLPVGARAAALRFLAAVSASDPPVAVAGAKPVEAKPVEAKRA